MIQAHFTKHLGVFNLQASMEDSGFILLSGRNGAGKSTFLLCLLGKHSVDSGAVHVNGRDVTCLPVEQRRIAFVNASTCFPHMDVAKHLAWGAREVKPDKSTIGEIRRRLGITFEGKVGKLSLGQRIRVSLATAILSNPEVLLIDEAISNLSGKDQILSELVLISKETHFDTVYVTQDTSEKSGIEHNYVLEEGRMTKIF